MLKENKNIDQSYTDRVVRQLVDETEIDFNAGKVHLPATNYSWTFDYFGPGGLENALRMTPSNSFGHHIINNYGIDEEEFEEVLTKYIEVIGEKINSYLAPIFNLQENKNIDWDYTDRVVKQLVDETEIDFKNSRVRLDAAEYSFPFYSFGSRRAHRENIIFEPNSKFGKHVISNYGVDETEYKEIYAMYMGVIASRLQDHDENVNHLYLHESSYTPKYYAPKWGVRRENDFLDRIVDGLVEESKIEYVEEIVHLADFSFQLFKAPFSYLQNIPETSPFYQHCMDVYGLTPEEIVYVWKEYRNIVRKEMQSSPLSNLISPFNESTEDNYLGTIVSQLVDETIIHYESGTPYISDFPDPAFVQFYLLKGDHTGAGIHNVLNIKLFNSLWRHCRNVYGLTDPEIFKVWHRYKKEIIKKIEAKGSLNESTEDNYLDKIVDQLVDESIIDYDTKRVDFSDFHPSFFADRFYEHCREVYGLTPEEIKYVWKEYKYIIVWKIKNKPLNESTEDNFLDKIVERLVAETQVFNDRGQLRANPPFFQSEWEDVEVEGRATGVVGGIPLAELIDSVESKEFDYSLAFMDFKYYCKQMYGLTWEESHEVWDKYREALYNTDFSHLYTPNVNLNESKKDLNSYVHTVVNKMVDDTHLSGKKTTNSIRVKLPFSIEDNIHRQFDEIGQYYITSPTARVVAEIRKHLILIYGMDKWETDQATLMYLSKMTDKINDYKSKGLNESVEDIYDKIANSVVKESEIIVSPKPFNKMFLKSPAWEQAVHIEVVLDIMGGPTKRDIPTAFTNHVNEIYNISGGMPMQTIWELYKDKMLKQIEDAKERLSVPTKQQKFFDHIVKTLVDETEIESTRHVHDERRERIWVTPPFITHGIDVPRYQQGSLGSVDWSDFSYFGYGYPRYMKDIYGLTDKEGLKLWAVYYKALEKKVDEVIERDRIIYGDD